MKSANEFWQVISLYNQQTLLFQHIIILIIIAAFYLSYKTKYSSSLKIALGLTNIYIGIEYFYVIDKSRIGIFFAGPLFIIIGLLFLFDSYRNFKDKPYKIKGMHSIAFIAVTIYPIISFILGNRYPEIVLYILPCPFISLSIVLYTAYKDNNRMLQSLMILWALTGLPKAFLFKVYEDLILFIIGCFGLYNLIKDSDFFLKHKEVNSNEAHSRNSR